jgi:dihydrofolate reductase
VLSTSTFLTLDGVMTDPHVWHPLFASDESLAMLAERMDAADAMVLGRRTSDEFAQYWPAQSDSVPLARRTNDIAKWVATSRPGPLGWANTTALEGDPIEAIRSLKERGDDLVVSGSATVVRAVLAAGLVDEVQIYLDPIIVGSGGRLFADGLPATTFELVDERALPKGMRYLAYRPVAFDRG